MGHLTTICSCHHEGGRRCEARGCCWGCCQSLGCCGGFHSREGVLLEEISLLLYEKVQLSSYRFLSWLILKLQAVGTEEEALERILSSRIPQNVPKKKTTRKQDLPDGAPRYGPQTPEFYASMLRNSGRRREPRKARGRWPPPPPVLMTLVLLLCPPNLPREPERLVQRPRFGQLWQKCCLFPPIVLIKTNWHVCVCVNLCSLKKICISDKLNWSVCIISAHAQAMNQIKVL